MSMKHQRFTDAQLQEAENGATGTDDVKSRMEKFASELDGVPVEISETGKVVEMPLPQTQPEAPQEPPKRKVRATPKRFKKVLQGIPEKLLNFLKVTPDEEDKEAIEEAADFLQDLFGFDFEVEESRTTIRSRWWALLWVGGVISLVFVKHRGIELLSGLGESEPNAFVKKEKTSE